MKIIGTQLEVEVVRHAICKTDIGIAGYAEIRTRDGKRIEIAGRWDDPYKSSDERIAEVWEMIIQDGKEITDKSGEGEGTMIFDGQDGAHAEDIMQEIAHNTGLVD